MATLLPNMPEYPILYMAAAEAGLVVTPLNPLYSPGVIRDRLGHSGSGIEMLPRQLSYAVKT